MRESKSFRTNNHTIILNPGAIRRSKLRIDMRKWFAARLEPKKYGDKAEVVAEKWRGLDAGSHHR